MIRIEIVRVTPEMAKAWLDKNKSNRPLRMRLVRAYAEEMAHRRWVVNKDTIGIATDGTLIDGQHRLNAVVLSGMSVDMLVMFDAPSDKRAVQTIDNGGPRNGGDALHYEGVERTKEAKAILSAMVNYSRPTSEKSTGPTLASMTTALHEKYGHNVKFVLGEAGQVKSPITCPFLAVVARADYHGVDRAYTAAFISLVKTGEPIERAEYEDTALLLGRMLLGTSRQTKSGSTAAKTATFLTERALLAYTRNEKLTSIRVSKTNPWPVVK
jgi:hypothetical protein